MRRDLVRQDEPGRRIPWSGWGDTLSTCAGGTLSARRRAAPDPPHPTVDRVRQSAAALVPEDESPL